MYQNFIYPKSTGDSCHFYQQKINQKLKEEKEDND